jgi:hypothetical protein
VKYLLALLLAACASVPVPNVRDVATAGHRVLTEAQKHHVGDANLQRRFTVALAAVDAVSSAQDARELRAAAPCAVEALRAIEPDVSEVGAVRVALEQFGGTCDVGRSNDAGVSP